MSKVRIYTTPICPYCVRAKALLARKGVPFEEIDVFTDYDARLDLEEKSCRGRSVPQIFIGERCIGGCDELYALDRSGELDRLLAG